MEKDNAFYEAQVAATRPLRDQWLQAITNRKDRNFRALEVGCGTGALMRDLSHQCDRTTRWIGVDLNMEALRFAAGASDFSIARADAAILPFADETFNAICCHYLLLWMADPVAALREMRRTLKPSGYVAAFAEPDYDSAFGFPVQYDEIARAHGQALTNVGIDPQSGRKLYAWFAAAGFREITCGVYANEWRPENRLKQLNFALMQSEEDGAEALVSSSRDGFIFTPTFYAFGIR